MLETIKAAYEVEQTPEVHESLRTRAEAMSIKPLESIKD